MGDSKGWNGKQGPNLNQDMKYRGWGIIKTVVKYLRSTYHVLVGLTDGYKIL